jgi:hypothetical protein
MRYHALRNSLEITICCHLSMPLVDQELLTLAGYLCLIRVLVGLIFYNLLFSEHCFADYCLRMCTYILCPQAQVSLYNLIIFGSHAPRNYQII